MSEIDVNDYRIERKNGKVCCYMKTSRDSEVILWVTSENHIDIPDLDPYITSQNLSVPQKLDLNYKVKHYHDMDTVELYKSYQRILSIIDRIGKDYRGRHAKDLKWDMQNLRSYCQVWLDDVRFRQDGMDRWWVKDRIKYFLCGKLKQRIAWLQTFGTICYDMCAKLDAIDGGNDKQQADQIAPQQHRIGF